VEGVGDQVDYGMRVYDPRAGRFLSVDPLREKYPWLSPYQFAENDVIRSIDLDGLEKQIAINGSVVTGPVNINAVNASILSNYTKSQQAALKQAAGERYIQEFARRNPQQIAPPSSSDRMESTEAALFRRNLNDPDNIGGQAAYSIAQNLHNARASFQEGNWGDGTLNLLNAGITTVTLTGAGPALGVDVKTEVKTDAFGHEIGVYDMKSFMSGATAESKNGLSVIGRALQKHVGREGSSFAGIKFSAKTATEEGLGILNDILEAKDRLIEKAENGTTNVFDQATGRGFNVSRNGLFNGFRDLKEVKK
jgi:hypothetical protein